MLIPSYMPRNLLLEVGVKMFGLLEDWVTATRTYRESAEDGNGRMLVKARLLAYSMATLRRHASAVKSFVDFCRLRSLSLFESTPYIVNLYIVTRVQAGDSFGCIQAAIDALSFVLRFFGVANYTEDPMVGVIKKFAEKTCVHLTNKKSPFGSKEVRAMWDALEEKYGGVQNFPKTELRTFVMAVFQHTTFCRFSDLEKITLDDVFHDVDFFKIYIRYSKTDQGGRGQWVYLPKSPLPFRNAHMLLCLYIEKMGFANCGDKEVLYLFPPLK